MSKAPPRPSMSKARRLRIFARDGGVCQICREKVKAGEAYDIDHIIPWALGFNDADDNLRTVHKTCHRDEKTGPDVARIAKAKRQGGEKGQAFRRAKRGFGLIKSAGFSEKPEGYKYQWGKRPFGEKKK